MPRGHTDSTEGPPPDETLRDALRQHAEVCGYRWKAQVQGTAVLAEEQRSSLRISVKLTAEDAAVLAALIRAVVDRQDRSLGTADVAKELNVTTSTIRSWLARGLPRENPFPQPRKTLGRSRWRTSEIAAWRDQQAKLDGHKRGGA